MCSREMPFQKHSRLKVRVPVVSDSAFGRMDGVPGKNEWCVSLKF